MKDKYDSPLCDRYASEAIAHVFSPDFRFSTWRRLWLYLAESEKELGLPITEEQIEEMRAHLTDIDYEAASEYERKLRHDVMAHLKTFADACPKAKGIIHLGATSCYVGDNTDIIQMREALLLIRAKLLGVIRALSDFALANKDVPTLAYTHFQAAQPTTAGKRAAMWLQDFMLDLARVNDEIDGLKLSGCKGTAGTGASFLALFHGDSQKVRALEEKIAQKLGFDGCIPVSGQTYTRKIDSYILNTLSGVAQSASKMATDLRLLSHLKEFDEPFESGQVGSSAMAYKRNPMRCERVVSLSRYVITQALNPAQTAATQWLERTLDDSANRRLCIPEAFMATDAILSLCYDVIQHGRLYPAVMNRHLSEELPFIATENILMRAVELGGDRQALHEKIRVLSVEAARVTKMEGGENRLTERMLEDPDFRLDEESLKAELDIRKFIGCAPEQTDKYIEDYVKPVLKQYASETAAGDEIRL